MVGRDRPQQRARENKAMGKEHTVLVSDPLHGLLQGRRPREHLADLVLQDLGVEELFGVLPLIERFRFIQSFITLQTDQLTAQRRRHYLGEFRLANSGWSFDQDRFTEMARQVHNGRDPPIANVFLLGEFVYHIFDRIEHSPSRAKNFAYRSTREAERQRKTRPALLRARRSLLYTPLPQCVLWPSTFRSFRSIPWWSRQTGTSRSRGRPPRQSSSGPLPGSMAGKTCTPAAPGWESTSAA